MATIRTNQRGEQIVACPKCNKHLNFSVVELMADMEVKFVGETELAPSEEYDVHQTQCPAGHSFYFAVGAADRVD